jgi:hypothetical protein
MSEGDCYHTFGFKACVLPAGHRLNHRSRSGSEWPQELYERASGCKCHWEEGDSPCPVHGDDEPPTPPPGAKGAACVCASGGPGSYDGPQRDCPVHGEEPPGAKGA